MRDCPEYGYTLTHSGPQRPTCSANQHPESPIKKENPTNLCAPREFLKEFVAAELCSRDLDVLRAQRIIGFLILFTHKSTSSENPIIWPLGVRYHKYWYKLHLSKYKLQSKLSNNSKRLGTNAFPGPVRDSATWDKLSGERYLSGYVWQFFFVLAGTGWT